MKLPDNIDLNREAKKCKTMEDLVGKNGLIKKMLKGVIESMLQAELEEHLGYPKYKTKNKITNNSRNGIYKKQIRSSDGDLELDIPRDRNGEFSPTIVKKHQKNIGVFDEKIISMYGRGMTTRDIQNHIYEMYGTEISSAMISMITAKIMPVVVEWQNRVLESVYSIVYFDAIHYKVRENGKIVCKAAYTCLGINLEGKKDILGIWIGESEGAHFWLAIFNELKSRGVKDILIASVDGLKGLRDAINSVFPNTETQLCVIHTIRNSLKYVGSKNAKTFMQDLKKVYQATSKKVAEEALKQLTEKWGKRYPLAVNPWINNWNDLSTYFKYPPELRRIIYTTNAVEGLHRQFRKVTKNRAVMANDDALLKLLFLAARNIQKNWTSVIPNWSLIISQLHIFFKERVMSQL